MLNIISLINIFIIKYVQFYLSHVYIIHTYILNFYYIYTNIFIVLVLVSFDKNPV